MYSHSVGSACLVLGGKRPGKVQHSRFGGFQDAVQTTKHDEGKDDLSILRLLEVTTKGFGDGPDEGPQVLDVSAHAYFQINSCYLILVEHLRAVKERRKQWAFGKLDQKRTTTQHLQQKALHLIQVLGNSLVRLTKSAFSNHLHFLSSIITY